MQRDHFVDDVLAMAKEIKVEPSQILFMRDNDPKSRDIASEKDMGLNVMAQSPKSPDMNVLDFSLWNYAVQKLTEEEFAWEKKNPGETFHESIDEFQKRLKRILLSLAKCRFSYRCYRRSVFVCPPCIMALPVNNGLPLSLLPPTRRSIPAAILFGALLLNSMNF